MPCTLDHPLCFVCLVVFLSIYDLSTCVLCLCPFGLHKLYTSEIYKTDALPPLSLFMSILLLSTHEKSLISHFKKEWRPHINTSEVSEIHKGSFSRNIFEFLNQKLRKQNIKSQGSNT